jgi:hypothetical protein
MKTPDRNNGAKAEASYPLYDLSEAVKVAEAVRDLGGGNAPVSKSLLAQHLKYAESGPSFFQRVTATKAFGLIEGRGSYSLTELAKQYFYPTVENGKESAAVKSLTFPKAFSILVQKFDGGKLPSIDMIGNIIHAEAAIPVSKKNILAGLFLRSVQFIGAIDAGGFLRCKASIAAGKSGSSTQAGTPTQEQKLAQASAKGQVPEVFSDQEEHSLFLDKEKTKRATFNCPLFITQAEFERVCNWIKATWIIEKEEKPE